MNNKAKLRKQLRQIWTPKREEMREQCASCPFREGNDAEFGAVMRKLAKANGVRTRVDVGGARFMVHREVEQMGDFICHQTAYDKDMKLRDASEHKQCPGATRHHKGTEPL